MTNPFDDREINRRIAEFMGWRDLKWVETTRLHGVPIPAHWEGEGPLGWGFLLADYANSVDALIPVIEKLREDDKYVDVASVGKKHYAADIYDLRDKHWGDGIAEGMAAAICLAILDYLEREAE